MRAGEFPDGAHVLRAKIDMASPNLNMRDPALYRIRHAAHHRTGDAWCIYPMYDYAHPISDALERITHSLCTLEFEDHRPLYDWLVEHLFERDRPRQIEFARLNLNYTVMSKRKLLQLVQQKHVSGWDDPADADDQRTPPPRLHAGVDPRFLLADRRRQERERHRRRAARTQRARRSEPARAAGDGRAAAAEGGDHQLPGGSGRGRGRRSTTPRTNRPARRKVPFSRVLYIEHDDFKEDPPKKFFRLSPGREVRLRCAYFITCTEVVKDAERRDRRAALHLRSGDARRRFARRPAGQGDAALGVGRACRPDRSAALRSSVLGRGSRARRSEGKTFLDFLNPASLEVLSGLSGRAEPGAASSLRARSSSSGSAISASIPIRSPAHSCSTGPCRSGTPGPRSKQKVSELQASVSAFSTWSMWRTTWAVVSSASSNSEIVPNGSVTQ